MKLYISPPYFQNNHIVTYKTGRVQITTAWGSGPQKAKIDRISSEDRKKWPSAQVSIQISSSFSGNFEGRLVA